MDILISVSFGYSTPGRKEPMQTPDEHSEDDLECEDSRLNLVEKETRALYNTLCADFISTR